MNGPVTSFKQPQSSVPNDGAGQVAELLRREEGDQNPGSRARPDRFRASSRRREARHRKTSGWPIDAESGHCSGKDQQNTFPAEWWRRTTQSGSFASQVLQQFPHSRKSRPFISWRKNWDNLKSNSDNWPLSSPTRPSAPRISASSCDLTF